MSGPVTNKTNGHECKDDCAAIPSFDRLNFFYGQMLSERDFKTEQSYFRDKLKLYNRYLHGYGVICGLDVVPVIYERPCDPADEKKRQELLEELEKLIEQQRRAEADDTKPRGYKKIRARIEEIRRELDCLPPPIVTESRPDIVHITCGVALDCEGRDLVVRTRLPVRLWDLLSAEEQRRAEEQLCNDDVGISLYVSLCYCELHIEPARPVLPDTCGATKDCTHSRVRDAVRVKVSLERPPEDERCDPCCEPCCDPCLLLACIDNFRPGRPLAPEDIRNDVRRRLSRYPPTTVTGISWHHGGLYTSANAKVLLGTDDESGGIKLHFSRKVKSETITPGVIDLWVIEGGPGRSGNIYHMGGEVAELDSPTTDWVRYRQTTGETLQEGDRVLIIIRGNFIIDCCCQPLDGEHVGGRVPNIYADDVGAENEGPPRTVCVEPPWVHGAWTSGNGNAGGKFESWFYIGREERVR